MTARKKIAPEYERVQEFIRRYSILPTDDDYMVATVWAMGTWTFSPAAPAMPVTYPYLYLTGPKGSGKTHLGLEVLQYICRNHKSVVDVTGPALFRMLGDYDAESGEVIPHYPTMAIDEIDATYGGAKDEGLRGPVNAGYKRGNTVPRAAGKTTIEFPVYCPKMLIGIDNGHLPDTIVDRSIRIDFERATPEQMNTIDELYFWDVEDESAEIQQSLADWAKREAMVLRDYRPEKIEGLSGRQWEIARSLVQLAKAIGIEKQMRQALHTLMTRNPEKPDAKVILYRAIFDLFEKFDTDRITTRMILEYLRVKGIGVPGGSGKGLASVLSGDGIAPRYIRVDKKAHPAFVEGKPTHRGFHRYQFDDAFIAYLMDEDDD